MCSEKMKSTSNEITGVVHDVATAAMHQAENTTESVAILNGNLATLKLVVSEQDKNKSRLEAAVSEISQGFKDVEASSQKLEHSMSQFAEVKTSAENLETQASRINEITSMVSAIAAQTNVLALNAAIEAARAGDAGRGFAVVADEVRKLAEKTMAATQEVGGVIRGIQDGTRKSIDGVERSVAIIEGATQRATISGESLAQIVILVEQASDQVRSIATASEQQSASSEEISRAVEQVATISAETAQAMGRASEAMSEMTKQAQVLRQLIHELKAG